MEELRKFLHEKFHYLLYPFGAVKVNGDDIGNKPINKH
jgi:hypothetical protein